jgi:hypothetical protein
MQNALWLPPMLEVVLVKHISRKSHLCVCIVLLESILKCTMGRCITIFMNIEKN